MFQSTCLKKILCRIITFVHFTKFLGGHMVPFTQIVYEQYLLKLNQVFFLIKMKYLLVYMVYTVQTYTFIYLGRQVKQKKIST